MNEEAVAVLLVSVISFLLVVAYPISQPIRLIADSTIGTIDYAARGLIGYDAYLITATIDIKQYKCTFNIERAKAYAHEFGASYVSEGEPHAEVTGNYTFAVVVNDTYYYGAIEKIFHGDTLVVRFFAPLSWSMLEVDVKVIDNERDRLILYGSGIVMLRPGSKEVVYLRRVW